jgi:tetratricopeptide (TPR) repeat protein
VKRLDDLKAARRALAQAPESPAAHRAHARALLRLWRPKAAVAAAREAVRLAPTDAYSLATLTELLAVRRSRRARKEALFLSEQLLRAAPGSALAHSVHGRALLANGRTAEAEAAYRRALELDPNDVAALNNLGLVLRRRAARSFRLSDRKLANEGLRQFAYAAETDPQRRTPRANVFRASGGWALLRWTWLTPYFLLRAAGGPGAAGVASWVARTTLLFAIGLVVLAVGLEVFRRTRARQLPPGARRYVEDETRRQRWRLWITTGVLALYVLVRWLAAWPGAPAGGAWLLLVLLAATVAASAWNVAGAVRRRAWRI